MNSELVESLIPETIENRSEIVRKIVSESGKDITREQKKYQDYEQIKTELTEAKTQITALEAAKGDATELQKQIDAYKAKEAERAEQETKTAKQRELAQRFTAARGASEFIDPDIEEAVQMKFAAALENPDNKGKGDADIYTALTKDKPYFKSQNPGVNMGGTSSVLGVDAVKALTDQYNDAVKTGKTAEAVALKRQLFSTQK